MSTISKKKSKDWAKIIGPGVITGAADDDPSGIATYSIAGARFGTQFLWTAWLTWPMMALVQYMCAQMGMVSGRGLSKLFLKKFPRWLVMAFSLSLLAANTFNVGADLAAMSDAAKLLTGWTAHFFILGFALLITVLTIYLHYRTIGRVLKWLVIALFAYVITAFYIGPDWKDVFMEMIHVHVPHTSEEWGMWVAILGTTISPYLFYWETEQEVEEQKTMGRLTLVSRLGATPAELLDRRLDVGLGTFFSNLIMFFIILTTALTLHRHGVMQVETSAQVAEALKPFAGDFASLLYTLGLVGTGLLAIPTLTGSAAYALAGTLGHRGSLDAGFLKAKFFYAIILLSTLVAVVMNFTKFNPVKALYFSAIINGVLAPILLCAILYVSFDQKLMANQSPSRMSQIGVGLVALMMFFACIGMFLF